jgi:acetyl esterase/lipase
MANWTLPDDVAPSASPVYKDADGIQLRLHVFQPDGDRPLRPGIVFFHGGGWTGGTPAQFYPQCHYLASRGMVAASCEYRLAEQHGTTPIECVKDARSAMRWLRRNAERFALDPDRLAAGGGSAGGHLAAACATLEGLDEADEDPVASCVPEALVLFNPVLDNGPEGGFGHERVQDYWQRFSPAHNVSAPMPPAIIFLGTRDHLIPVKTILRFQEEMQKAGARCELRLYDDAEHGFFNPARGDGSAFRRTLAEADAFLASLGLLSGPPRIEA